MLVRSTVLFLLAFSLSFTAVAQDAASADKILTNATIWTGDQDQPTAEAIAIRGNRILAVGSEADVAPHEASATETIDLDGRFVVPGFIDNHTHFNNAGALKLGINLLDVNDPESLVREVRAAQERLPEGAWITGGDWGAYAQWEHDEDEDAPEQGVEFDPHRDLVDDFTQDTPVFLSRWDGERFLANQYVLDEANLSCDDPGVHCENGEMTGLLDREAAAQIREIIPERAMEQRIAEAHKAMASLAEQGVTTIHDNTPPEQMRVFHQLDKDGELTVRVYARPTLDKWSDLAAAGISHGFGNDWLEVGGLKGFVDGILGNSTAMFYEPYEHQDEEGIWRDMMDHPDGMQGLIEGAAEAGHWPQIHAIGDKAIDTLLTMYDRAQQNTDLAENPDQRWRVIHAQHLRGPETAQRMAELNLIAEMQPYHAIDDMRWVEERVGQERARYTYAFRTLQDAGVMLSFGSDWPGTNASWYPADPLQGIYAATVRKTLGGNPEGGWFPEERIDVESALKAYTVNNAYAAGQENNRGQLTAGYLADLVVLSEDITAIEPADILDVDVLRTMVNGEWVFEKE